MRRTACRMMAGIALPLALAGLLPAVGGCQMVGWLAHATGSNPKVPARYVLEKKPTLILVENYRNPGGAEADGEQLAGYIAQHMKPKDLAPLVSAQKLHDLQAARGDGFRSMKISDVAAAVGAAQVIYVDLEKLETIVATGGGIFQGAIKFKVKVVGGDGRTLWPAESVEGHPLESQTNWMARDQGFNEYTARDQMLRSAGLSVARLFQEYDPNE